MHRMTTDDDRSLIESTLYERLLADMTNGQFHNGTPLRVQSLAQKYGSSANPVREVLRRMEGEGLVGPVNHVGRREIFRDQDGNPL